MTNRVINIQSRPLRAFYRIYILPQHIERREGGMRKALEDELAGHQAFVKENKLEKQLAEYIKDQQARQSAYDEAQRLRGEVAVLQGVNLNKFDASDLAGHAEKLKSAADALVAADERLEQLRAEFPRKWH